MKLMTAISAEKLRDLIDGAREMSILKEDIVSLLKTEEGYTLIYYS